MTSAYRPSRDGVGLIEIGVDRFGRVHVCEPDVGEERLVCLGLDVVGGLTDDQLIEQRPHLQVELAHLGRLAALHALPDMGCVESHLLSECIERRIRCPAGLVGAVLVTPPLVEALVVRQTSLSLTAVPLAEQRRGVARVGEQLGDRVLPGDEAGLAPGAGRRHLVGAGSHRLAAGQDGRTRRGALGLDRVVVEPDAPAGQFVNSRRRRRPAVAGEVTPADVVAQNEDDVGLVRGHLAPRWVGTGPRWTGATPAWAKRVPPGIAYIR